MSELFCDLCSWCAKGITFLLFVEIGRDDDDEFLYGSSAAAPTEPNKTRALTHSPPVATPGECPPFFRRGFLYSEIGPQFRKREPFFRTVLGHCTTLTCYRVSFDFDTAQSPNGIVARLETEVENAVVPGLSDAVTAATAAVVAAQAAHAHAQAQAQAHAQAQAEAQAQEAGKGEEEEEQEQVELGEESEEEEDVSTTLITKMMLTRLRTLNSSWNHLTARWIFGRFHSQFVGYVR